MNHGTRKTLTSDSRWRAIKPCEKPGVTASAGTRRQTLSSRRAERSPRPSRRRSLGSHKSSDASAPPPGAPPFLSSVFGESTAYYSSGGPGLRGRPRAAEDGSLLSCHPEDDECSKGGKKISPQSSGPEVRTLRLTAMCNFAAD